MKKATLRDEGIISKESLVCLISDILKKVIIMNIGSVEKK